MKKNILKAAAYIVGIACLLGIASLAFRYYAASKTPVSFISGNGRIEAQEVDITAKLPGRVVDISVKEGDLVVQNQIVARLDTNELNARMNQAAAQIEQAMQSKNYALAIVKQRASELDLSKKNLERSKTLYVNNDISLAQLQQHESTVEAMNAALAAAKAQVVNTDGAIAAAKAAAQTIKTNIDDSSLKSPINGSVLYRLVEPGEVVGSGGKVLTLIESANMYMTIFLPTEHIGRVKVGAEARIKLDSPVNTVIAATVSFVSPDAQFTPKEIETKNERDKLMFRVKVKINTDFLKTNGIKLNSGLPAETFVRLDDTKPWPKNLDLAKK